MDTIVEIKKLPTETEEQFLWKVGQLVDSGKVESWSSVNDVVNKELGIDEDKWRDESSFRKRYQAAKKFYDGCFSKMECEEHQKKLDVLNRELQRNTIKFRDQRNAWQRQNYADTRVEETLDILEEKLCEIGKVEFTNYENVEINSDNDLICCLSDLHIGETFSSNFGEYNSSIAQRRLDEYLLEIVKIGRRHNSENVYLSLLGDQISGNIHLSIQVSNKENVIEQVKLSAELITNFACELSKYFKRVFIIGVAGNHSRLIANKDKDIKDERLDTLITWIIEQMTKHIDNIVVLHRNLDSGISDLSVRGKTYLGVHGDNDSMNSNAVGKLCMMLGFFPYAIIGGHRHTPAYQEFNGIKYIQSGSLAGSGDDYTLSQRLSGKANQTVLVCSENGIDAIYNVELK